MRVKQIQEGQGLYLTLWEAQTEQVRVELQGQVVDINILILEEGGKELSWQVRRELRKLRNL